MEPLDTRVSLKEYFDEQIKNLKDIFARGREEIITYFNTRLAALEDATKAIECRLEQYFDLKIQSLNDAFREYRLYMEQKLKEMNEFRGALKDVMEFQSSAKDLESAVKALEAENKHILEVVNTKADYESTQLKIQANDAAIRQLEKYRAVMEAKASQASVMIALAISVIGIVLTLINMFSK
jgi:hypothetical protein